MHDDAAPLFPDPDEVDGFWNWDKMHAPRPLSPLAQDVVVGPLVSGFTAAMAEFDSPLEMHRFFVHHYYFSSTRPLADPAERAARAERYGATLDRELARIGPRWENEWKPWLIAHAHAERQRDPSTLDDDALV
ncbi:MAG: hypothetical protein OEY23_08310, partial [Acidimicrobiia bacterium]|nr:hypothetical protein [Acidimicrobiia bacterium]